LEHAAFPLLALSEKKKKNVNLIIRNIDHSINYLKIQY